MAVLTFTVPSEWDGRAMKYFLREYCGVSSALMRRAKLLPMGITMDGVHTRSVDPVRCGAVVAVDMGDEDRQYTPLALPVDVLYEDEGLIVLNKPSGLPTHPSLAHPSYSLGNVFASLGSCKGLVFRPINRLDKDTSGVVFAAKNRYVASTLPPLITKRYIALAHGQVHPPQDEINLPIDRLYTDSVKRGVMEGGQTAHTIYNVLGYGNNYTVLELELLTGRTHQIRVHLSHIGHPLLGDTLYGGRADLISATALHCHTATVRDYAGGFTVTAQVRDDMRGLMESVTKC